MYILTIPNERLTKTETGSRIAIPWPPCSKMDMTS